MNFFSMTRFLAIIRKEFIQVRRDRFTFAMMLGVPFMQLILFGLAININPHYLPTAVMQADYSPFTQKFLQALENTRYFKIVAYPRSIQQADELLINGKVVFIVSIPPDFTRDLIARKKPQILVEADATYPGTASSALAALPVLQETAFDELEKGALSYLKKTDASYELVTHVRYNPENITQYSIIPGLLGVILTMTMVMITSLAVTRERERGTMESLLATPVNPIEVILGKILPYVFIGYIQLIIILLTAYYLFHVPFYGNVIILFLLALPFIAANLAVGLMFSSIAKNQLQAVQMAFFFFLPSILLSGFVFPFDGMPSWARVLGNCLPLTHFVRIVRGIVLKGSTFVQVWSDVWPMFIFIFIVLLLGLKQYRQTLD